MTCFTVYLGLGGNLGPRSFWLHRAIDRLRHHPDITDLRVSPLWVESSPQGCAMPQGFYLNTAVRLQTSLDPVALLAVCQAIEHALGRSRDRYPTGHHPRNVDLDILEIWQTNTPVRVHEPPHLIIPHPRAHDRDFVQAPLLALKNLYH